MDLPSNVDDFKLSFRTRYQIRPDLGVMYCLSSCHHTGQSTFGFKRDLVLSIAWPCPGRLSLHRSRVENESCHAVSPIGLGCQSQVTSYNKYKVSSSPGHFPPGKCHSSAVTTTRELWSCWQASQRSPCHAIRPDLWR